MVSFDTTREELELISKIADRAALMALIRCAAKPKHWYRRETLMMDLSATHANGCPLDFQRLLEADDFNFAHDVCGIARHMDRDTGKLTDHFLPRFAAKASAAA